MPRRLLAYVLAFILLCVISPGASFAQSCCDPEVERECLLQGGFLWPGDGGCTCSQSPVLVDLSGKGLMLTSASAGVRFDLNADGKPEQIAWTAANSSAAFLVLDRNGNGIIDNGLELFGNVTIQPQYPDRNGFAALAEFDKPENGGNGDGLIDSEDSIFVSLRLWIDNNHNGISEASELFTLPDLGVHSISLAYKEEQRRDRFRNRYRYRAAVNIGEPGDTVGRFAYDVFFSSDLRERSEPPATIKGSEHPELIPTEVAFNIFLRVASCPDNATPLQQKKCKLVRRAVGLQGDDDTQLAAELASFAAAIQPLDQQLATLHGAHDDASQALKKTILAQRRDVHKARWEVLRQKLTGAGRQQLDSYVEAMKTKIKIIPTTAAQ